MTPENLVQLKKYDWPGNIRELKSCIEKAIFISEEGSLINIKVEKVSCAQPYSLQNDGDEGYVSLEYLEKQHIEHVLLASKGNKHQAAQILGIDRTTLYNKLKKYQSFQNIENLVLK